MDATQYRGATVGAALVSGRALAAYQATSSGGIALGAWGWGHLTDLTGVETALLIAGVLMLASPLIGLWLRMPAHRRARRRNRRT